MRNIHVQRHVQIPIERQKIEIVERKGLGHPDTLADGIAESMSRALSKEYLKRFGIVLHHNTDETQIVAGKSKPSFGGGEIIQPIFVLLVGRATKEFEGTWIPTDKIALKAAKEYVRKTMANLNPDEDIVFDVRIGEGSTNLQDVFMRRRGEAPHANDTSFGIGFAPLTETEKIVYNVERRIYNEFRKREKAVGEDVKVMGLRVGDRITLTVACATVDRYLDSLKDYVSVVDSLKAWIEDVSKEYTDRNVEVHVNTADDYERGNVYLTVTGTSAECGDDGNVGRGNRCNGLITPYRPMSLEASAGKNPVNHVGKIYNVLANFIARECYEKVEGIEEIYVKILSQIGKPINEPKAVDVQIIPKDGYDVERMERGIFEIVEGWLDNVTKVTKMIVNGDVDIF